ncbi:ATP-grasp domain-containing protein [Corynebacterium lizhenjunii]|uniref:ATP-grasp domain-containing protein n=1 Tax=Corynebacterium lizhenjunii TaxID=2709394 RepID=UPI0013EB8B6E|nr:ATP-grasp domain-containing protein [Corynebacterium lizhenjunii]
MTTEHTAAPHTNPAGGSHSRTPRVLLLGPNELGDELVIAFRRLGVDVYTATGCDEHAVLDHCIDVQPDIVLPMSDRVSISALRGLEERGITVIPSAHACACTRDRKAMYRAAESLGLPVAAHQFASSEQELETAVAELGYPCMVKRNSGTADGEQYLVRDEGGIGKAWHSLQHPNEDKLTAVVERYVDFDYEMTLLAVRSIDPATGALATWFSEPIGHQHAGGKLAEAWQPLEMSQRALENARSVAARISNELGGRGLYGVELFVAGDDVYFSAVTPRPLDTGILTSYTQRLSQYQLHARAALGYPIDVTLTSPGAAVVVADLDGGVLDGGALGAVASSGSALFGGASSAAATSGTASDGMALSGLAEALAYAETDFRVFGESGAGVRGLVVTTAETVAEAQDKAALAAGKVRLTGGEG